MGEYITYFIIGLTVFTSWQAWERPELFDRFKFQMSAILDQKQYDRIFTSGFIHADGMHLFFNMFALYVFMPVVLYVFSIQATLLIYILAILSGNLLTILAHHKGSLVHRSRSFGRCFGDCVCGYHIVSSDAFANCVYAIF